MKVLREGRRKLRSIVKALKNYKLDVRDKGIKKAKDYMKLFIYLGRWKNADTSGRDGII